MEDQKGMELMNFVWIMCILTMVGTSMVSKPRVLLGFHPNPKIIESNVGKTLNGTRRVWNPPFEVGFMV